MKIVFFIQTTRPISSDQRVFLDLANYFTLNSNHEVYYMNNYWDIDASIYEKVNYIDCNDFDEDYFREAVFFAPTNYLGNLLSVIRNIPKARICLLSYNIQSVKWLANALGNLRCEKDLYTLFRVNNACAFISEQQITPELIDSESDLIIMPPALHEEMIPYKSAGEIINKDAINIAFVSPINNVFLNAYNNILRCFKNMKLKKDITFHFIGETSVWINSFKSASEGFVRIVCVGDMPLKEEETRRYLQENADLIFASGQSALQSAQFGIPVVIPVEDVKPVASNDFVWLFDADKNVYKWNADTLFSLDYDKFNLRRILEAIYEKDKKEIYARKCYDFVKENASIEYVAKQFLKLIETSTLTVSECFSLSCINKRIQDFELYQKYYDGTYNDFLTHYQKNAKVVIPTNKEDEKIVKFLECQKSYPEKIEIIKGKEVIKVAFLVVFKTTFPVRPVFEKMLHDSKFDPYIVVCPNVSRGKFYQKDLYRDTLSAMKEQYGNRVIGAYDENRDEYLELKDEYSILFFCNPYKILVHPFHDVEYFLDKPCLPIYANYGYPAITYWDECIKLDFYSYMWKVCIENDLNMQYLQKVQAIKGENALLTGYIKMDDFAQEKEVKRERKTILICPHHTVTGWEKLDISNFLKYSDFFLELPKMFPDIDFIFRPHPLLLTNLTQHGIWSQRKVDNYLDSIEAIPNMRYDDSGYYFNEFVNSDAMIHDCASFIAEYLFTKKPCCYMMKTESKTLHGLTPFGKKCMQEYYHALSQEDIIAFIKDVVLDGKDPKKQQREQFVENELMINYPNAAEFLVNYLKKTLENDEEN